jgi:endoglucanase
VKGRWVLSRSIDDLMGGAISLETLKRVVRAKLKTNLTVLLHRAEEVGFMGALDIIAEGALDRGDSVLSIETSREMPGARPGKGPVIRLGDKACLFDPNLTALLDEAAQKSGRVQRLRLTGGTCEATAYQTFGWEAGGVAIPLVNYHNGWGAKKIAPEMVRREDADGAVKLLVEAARLFGRPNALRGTLRARLTKRHADLRRFL